MSYCESAVTNQPGDIEHYRPKAGLYDENNKPVMMIVEGEEIEHPGYYWLAYKWKNLLPSCRDCNSPTKEKTGGVLIGKGNQFPVKSHRAIIPDDHVNEKALILNPMFDDPSMHIKIDALGVLYSDTEEGKTCINIFGLNKKESLIADRKHTYDEVYAKMTLYITELINEGSLKDFLSEEIENIKKGKKPFTIAALQAMRDFKSKNEQKIINAFDFGGDS